MPFTITDDICEVFRGLLVEFLGEAHTNLQLNWILTVIGVCY